MSRRVLGAMVLVLSAACGQGAQPVETTAAAAVVESTAAEPSTKTTPPETTTTTEAQTTTTAAADAAPPELAGVWRANDPAGGRVVTVTLRGNQYQINAGPEQGTGKIPVEGDLITLSEGSLCEDEGGDPGATYRWGVEGDILTMEALEPLDICGRRAVLNGVEYRRFGD